MHPSPTPSSFSHAIPILQPPPSPSLSRRRVLVVDDDREVREGLRELLMDAGYEVLAAGNGQQALTTVLVQTPDVVLLDLVMPVMSGWEFLELRPWYPVLNALSIIVMSSAVDSALGVAAVVSKPFRFDDVLRTVRRVAAAPVRQDFGAPLRGVARSRA